MRGGDILNPAQVNGVVDVVLFVDLGRCHIGRRCKDRRVQNVNDFGEGASSIPAGVPFASPVAAG